MLLKELCKIFGVLLSLCGLPALGVADQSLWGSRDAFPASPPSISRQSPELTPRLSRLSSESSSINDLLPDNPHRLHAEEWLAQSGNHGSSSAGEGPNDRDLDRESPSGFFSSPVEPSLAAIDIPGDEGTVEEQPRRRYSSGTVLQVVSCGTISGACAVFCAFMFMR